MALRTHLGVVCVALLGLISAGCTPGWRYAKEKPQSGAPAKWMPDYGEATAPLDPESEWGQYVQSRLLWRTGFDRYWELLRLVLDVAPGAEAMVLMEELPDGVEEEYGYCLLVKRLGRTFLFESRPLMAGDQRLPLWGYEIPDSKAEEMWRYFGEVGIYKTKPEAFDAVHLERRVTAVHLFRVEDRAATSALIDNPILDWDVVEGRKALSTIAEAGLTGVADDDDAAHVQDYFERTYRVRVVVDAVQRMRFRGGPAGER